METYLVIVFLILLEIVLVAIYLNLYVRVIKGYEQEIILLDEKIDKLEKELKKEKEKHVN